MVVLDDARLNRILQDPLILREFPELRSHVKTGPACCPKGPPVVDYNALKAAVAVLPVARLARFKELVGAAGPGELRIVCFRDGKVRDDRF